MTNGPDSVERLNDLTDGAWVVAAFAHLVGSGVLNEAGDVRPTTPSDRAALDVLAAAGVTDLAPLTDGGMLRTYHEATKASLRQLVSAAGIATTADPEAAAGEGWAAHDDETLLAQGRSSAFGGTMLARMAVPSLEGLSARFDPPATGVFLDVGVGVGELTAAFCDALPDARAIGLDVMPRVLELARRTIAERGLDDRVELRQQGVQELADEAAVDLAWLPAPFIPEEVFDGALVALHRALRPGGWLVVGAGRLDDGTPVSIAVTRWKTVLAGGTALPRADAQARLAAAGFVDVTDLPMPPGAPALYAARRP